MNNKAIFHLHWLIDFGHKKSGMPGQLINLQCNHNFWWIGNDNRKLINDVS